MINFWSICESGQYFTSVPTNQTKDVSHYIKVVFVDKPDAQMFKFEPEDYLEMNKARFKSIKEFNTPKLKNSELYTFIGVLY